MSNLDLNEFTDGLWITSIGRMFQSLTTLAEDCLADSQSGMFLSNFLVMTSGIGVSVHIEEDARLNSVDAIHYFEYLQHITSSSPML